MLEEERESQRLETRGNQTGDVCSCGGHLTQTELQGQVFIWANMTMKVTCLCY